MIIRNIAVKTKRIKLSKKLRQFISKIYIPIVAVLIVGVASAAVMFKPSADLLGNLLYKSVLREYDADNNGKILPFGFDIDVGDLALMLSYPMIVLPNQANQTAISALGVTEDLSEFDESAEDIESEEGENKTAGYENMPIVNDEPIMSIYEYYKATSGAEILEVEAGNAEIPSGTYRITPMNFSGQKTAVPQLLLSNQTSFTLDLNDFIKLKYPIKDGDISSSEPLVLILCTHATESYCETGTSYYAPAFTAERTSDITKNIVLIATEIKNTLEEYGIPVIQSLKIHDEVSYQNSYIRSLETMNAYVKEYPSIKYVIDVHRDSMIAETGEKYKPTININGKNASQIMMVIGTSDGGANHPNWTDNLTFATYLQQRLNDKYPMMARPINLRSARFNQHVTKGSIILEVGSCGSSFDEALYSAKLFGECFAELIIENSVQ